MNTALPSRLPTAGAASPAPAARPTLAARLAGGAWPGLAMLLGLALVAAWSLRLLFPRAVTPASAPAAIFSAERALAHLPAIAKEPHPAGSPAQAAVRDYLAQQLSALGLEVQVQASGRIANVVARRPGSQPSGAVVILAHYDSQAPGPGAADNGAGVAALLEVMRALAAGPQPANDVIALFDDAEEAPCVFCGAKLFVREHPWMANVRVAISLDTAAAGPINVVEIGAQNGFIVQALARVVRPGWAWTSGSGGGQYDTYAFRVKGIQAVALEDNYAFRQKHTAGDTIDLVRPGSVQQLGDQALALARELGRLDLGNPRAEQETYFILPLVGLAHYPQAWSLPLAVAAGLLLLGALALALRKRVVSWRGLAASFVAILGTAALGSYVSARLWAQVPRWLGWRVAAWPDWPEVIPPHGGLLLAAFGLLGLALALGAYALCRRVSRPASVALAALAPFAALAVFLALGEPRAAFLAVWPVLVGAVAWLLGLGLGRRPAWATALPAAVAAAACLVHLPAFIVGDFLAEGFNAIAIFGAIWPLLLFALLPALDEALARVRGCGFGAIKRSATP